MKTATPLNPMKQVTSSDPLIVQLFHSGFECPVERVARGAVLRVTGASVPVPWIVKNGSGQKTDGNCRIVCNGHTRRLLAHEGEYVDSDGNVTVAKLAFWGEWEAETTATKLPSPKAEPSFYARWIHVPSLPKIVPNSHCINTDPCVFGRSFKYCCCMQHRKGETSPYVTRRLPPGSIVLFGSRLRGEFVLDTVFVVDGTWIDYQTGNTSNLKVSKTYRTLTLDRLEGNATNTFYRGAVFNREGEPFSFVPTRLFKDGDSGCSKRFRLDVHAVNQVLNGAKHGLSTNPKMKQGLVLVRTDPTTVLRVWNEILRQVRKGYYKRQGAFLPATHFDWPNHFTLTAKPSRLSPPTRT